MRIQTLLSPLNVDELYFTGKTVVVIDVLRTTTVITTALLNGAKEITPVNSIEFAMKISGGGHVLLGGERKTKMIDGFNLGNSPLEYTSENVDGKSIILFTTNGTGSIVRTKFADDTFIGCFNNLQGLAEHLLTLNKDIEILCSGSHGMFCLEDTVCAGKLIRKIQKLEENIELSDASLASLELNAVFGKSIFEMLSETEHGKFLIENGNKDDIRYCSELDVSNLIPVFQNGVIKPFTADQE